MTSTTPDINVSLPHNWAIRSTPSHGVVLAARARELPPSRFAPEIVVRTTPVATDLSVWREEALVALSEQLSDFALEDGDDFTLEGHPVAYHRFAHRVGVVDVLVEQWCWLVDGVGVTLTGSVGREDYLAYGEVFEQVAETVEFRPRAVA